MVGLIIALGNIKYLSTPWFYGPPLLLILGLIVAGVLAYLSRVRQLHAATGLTAPVEYIFSADKLIINAAEGTGELAWPDITGASVVGSWLLLTTGGALQPFVDLRAVQAPATAAALLQLLRAKGFTLAE
ncbi:hypothetical protein [Hymenobacter sp. CRA2]|uniref:hypothetical protein n=1 Tax=Hymenobacter sp. CRA2 TaxID=1955620 RepID=UPI00098EBB83|nr:hypothetical protein [Hymenobacter sp. CRA2]OON68787.1 hypothetical protein B0919_11410 [Hymenobacter sp. CRA2]